ncbi:MAG: glutamate synthase, partial [Candidatus Thioglobus sp.]
EETTVEADLIVSAIGQLGDLEGVEEYGNERGFIDADKFYQVPGKEGHFVAGDIIRPHLLTTAIGHGSIAAETIHEYINQEKMDKRPKVDKHHFDLLENLDQVGRLPSNYDDTKTDDLRGTDTLGFAVHNYDDRSEHEIVASSELFLGHFEHEDRVARNHKLVNVDNVLGNFDERLIGYTAEEAQQEAGRCMSCGLCFECDNCVMYCPQDAVFKVKKDESTLGRYVDTDYDKCIGCHICADVCPTGYIQMGLGSD